MCRFLAYSGEPVWLDELLIVPESSLVSQSLHAREAKTVVNGDGCGIGWYGEREEPGIYRGILPAWSDKNLSSICHQLKSRLFLAHVRSATTGGVSMSNCHPFGMGRHLFMHNGQIGGYEHIKRRIETFIPDEIYANRCGNSDSEAIFLIAAGLGLDEAPVDALAQTLKICSDISAKAGIDQAIRFSAIHSDGKVLRAFRWSSDRFPPTLYWRRMEEGIAVASEPFGTGGEHWEIMPTNCVATIDGFDISFEPFDPLASGAEISLPEAIAVNG
jgi:predicted glutamine amidotransferase